MATFVGTDAPPLPGIPGGEDGPERSPLAAHGSSTTDEHASPRSLRVNAVESVLYLGESEEEGGPQQPAFRLRESEQPQPRGGPQSANRGREIDLPLGLPAVRHDIPEPVLGGPAGERHTIVRELGHGTFGSVFLAEENRTGRHAAVKACRKRAQPAPGDLELMARELHMLGRLSHPSVVQLLDAIQTPNHVMFIMEYAGPRNLFQAQQNMNCTRFHLAQARPLFAQIAAGVAHCHDCGVAHRDLKPENVVVSADGQTAKVVDFGAASTLSVQCELLGTVPFMSPELMALQADQYSAAKADVWSLGVILLEMLCGFNCIPAVLGWHMPRAPGPLLAVDMGRLVADWTRIHRMLKKKLRSPQVSPDLENLLCRMLSLSVPQRCTAAGVVSSAWLAPVGE